jgi:hypothetical protein
VGAGTAAIAAYNGIAAIEKALDGCDHETSPHFVNVDFPQCTESFEPLALMGVELWRPRGQHFVGTTYLVVAETLVRAPSHVQ